MIMMRYSLYKCPDFYEEVVFIQILRQVVYPVMTFDLTFEDSIMVFQDTEVMYKIYNMT
jgi:hypothetical protein